MAKLFEPACYPEIEGDFENFKEEAQLKGWTIIGVDNLNMGYSDDPHCNFLCSHDWRDVKALAETLPGCRYIAQSVMPLNIYDGQQRDRINGEYYYDHTIPKVQFVHGGDIIWSLPLDAMIPPLSGKELKEHALRVNMMVSLTYLSGEPLKDEDTIVAPAIDRRLVYYRTDAEYTGRPEDPDCPGHVIFNFERVRKTRLRGKQNAMNLYKPY